MNFLSGLAKSGSDQPTNADPQEKPSNADLFASAKVVAEAAQAQFSNEPEKYDKGKASGAAADLLDAASEYGKLDETQGIGKYVDQAEGYLRQYGTTASGDQKTVATDATFPAGKEKTVPTTTTTTETTDSEKPSGGGAGDYIKKAEGFLNKPSEGGAEAGGAGDYIKKAEDLVDKPSGGAEGGGAGDYIKKAEELLNKPSGDGGEKSEPSSQSEGGYGDLLKAAGGFLNK